MPDAHRLDLNFLTLFEALHRERSVTGAAQQVGLSQPATSSALGRMRRLFGDPLFVRTPQGMVPTPLAEEIAPAVREALDTVRRRVLERPVAEPASEARTLRLSVSDASGHTFLPRIVRKMQHVAPGWRIEAQALHAADLPQALESGAIELAITSFPIQRTGIFRQRLASSEFQVIHRRDHPRLRSKPSLRDYLDARHAVMHPPGAPPSVLEQALSRQGHQRSVALTVPHFLLLPAIVAESDLIATVPSQVARAFAAAYRLAVWPLPFPMPELVLYQYWHQRSSTDAGVRWVRGLIRELFGKEKQA